jgi:type VI secretion system protein ImpK
MADPANPARTASDDATLIQHAPTILMPAPGGQPTLVMPRPALASPPASPLDPQLASTPAKAGPAVDLHRLVAGVNPLLRAADMLLALAGQLRATRAHADPAALHRQLLERMAEFEATAAASGVPRPQVGAARYVLCCLIDEAIAATPWGGHWAERTLLHAFHEERDGGDKVFKLLERLGEDPAEHADLLELFYVCLALGLEGRYRGRADARAQLDTIAGQVRQHLRRPEATPAADAPRVLSPSWQGVQTAGHPERRAAPLWALAAVGAALLVALALVLQARLDAMTRPLFGRIVAVPALLASERAPTAPATASSTAPPAAAVAAPARLAPALAAEAPALEVRDQAQRSLVTLAADTLFEPGSARVAAPARERLQRVADALRAHAGQVVVIGHTDDAPTASLRFPSNWHLSRERAQAVAEVLAARGLAGVQAEGRAEFEPRAPNTSAAERARNRRIEIELRLPRPDAR